jgi:ABC-type ATPase involved in cell division
MNIFKELNSNGQTIILITHEDSIIAKQSNRIITIMDGLIKSDIKE